MARREDLWRGRLGRVMEAPWGCLLGLIGIGYEVWPERPRLDYHGTICA
jgi:hypothetical protein